MHTCSNDVSCYFNERRDVARVRNDALEAIVGEQYPFSCYGPYEHRPSLARHIEDLSFEEVHLLYHDANQQNSLEKLNEVNKTLNERKKSASSSRCQLLIQPPLDRLKEIYDAPKFEIGHVIINNIASLFQKEDENRFGGDGSASCSANSIFAKNETSTQTYPINQNDTADQADFGSTSNINEEYINDSATSSSNVLHQKSALENPSCSSVNSLLAEKEKETIPDINATTNIPQSHDNTGQSAPHSTENITPNNNAAEKLASGSTKICLGNHEENSEAPVLSDIAEKNSLGPSATGSKNNSVANRHENSEVAAPSKNSKNNAAEKSASGSTKSGLGNHEENLETPVLLDTSPVINSNGSENNIVSTKRKNADIALQNSLDSSTVAKSIKLSQVSSNAENSVPNENPITFVDAANSSPGTYQEEEDLLPIGVLCKEGADHYLTDDEIQHCKDLIMNAILSNGPTANARGYESKDGSLIIKCSSEANFDWIKNLVEKFPMVDNSKFVFTRSTNKYIRYTQVTGWVSDDNLEIADILACLETQNPGISTKLWQVLSHQKEKNEENELGFKLVIQMDQDSVNVLTSKYKNQLNMFLGAVKFSLETNQEE